jgi:hypothetical protein
MDPRLEFSIIGIGMLFIFTCGFYAGKQPKNK